MPEFSAAFMTAYDAAKARFEGTAEREHRHTLEDAVTAYLDFADYKQLARNTRIEYRRVLDQFRMGLGKVMLPHFTEARIEDLRSRYIETPIAWNSLCSRMIMVIRHYRQTFPGVLEFNHWEASRRLRVPRSNVHRPWPPEVLLAVMRASTPEFRALLVGYLLTAQRGGDVTSLSPQHYNPEQQTLTLTQGKTDTALVLHVPPSLAAAFTRMRGRNKDRLFVTPRGVPWDTKNAQETMRRILSILQLDRYTLHGLRATGPVALKLLGFENRAIRALTGHTSDANLDIYLRGTEHYPLAVQAQNALEAQFSDLLADAEEDLIEENLQAQPAVRPGNQFPPV